MSIAQIKKRYAELEAYLGKDKEGIKRLKLYKDEVNKLRTDLAAAKEETQLAVTIKDAARERADAAETAMKELRIHSESQDIKIKSMAQRVEALSKSISELSHEEEPAEEEDLSADNELAAMRIVMRRLRKKLRYCPETIGALGLDAETHPIFARDDIAKGWSYESIWTLGAAVAVLTAILGRFAIYGDKRLLKRVQDGENSNTGRHAYEWLSHNNDKQFPAEDGLHTAVITDKQKQRNSKGAIFDRW